MKKIFFLMLFMMGLVNPIWGQSVKVESCSPKSSYVFEAEAEVGSCTIIGVNLYSTLINTWISFGDNIVLQYIDPQSGQLKELPVIAVYGLPVKDSGDPIVEIPFNEKINVEWMLSRRLTPNFELLFPLIPFGVNRVSVVEKNVRRGFSWQGIRIKPREPKPDVPFFGTKEYIDDMISVSDNYLCGYYEQIDERSNGYHLAFVTRNDSTFLIYMGSDSKVGTWKPGEIKAILRGSLLTGIYKADWFLADKSMGSAIVGFDDGLLKIKVEGAKEEDTYIPMKGKNNAVPSSGSMWTGSGFALNNGYIVTNYHVAGEAKKIEIFGISGDFTKSYDAKLVGTDKTNDLALLKIEDDSFTSFGTIPYAIDFKMSEVGEEIFVLGYPLTATMGEEVKLTNGIISSRSGFDGDVSLYQMTAPIQPGNSGGPMFDYSGNLVGIICAHHKGAENAGYAIKTSYLKNMVESLTNDKVFPVNNTIRNLPLKDKVKNIRNFVFLIKCSK